MKQKVKEIWIAAVIVGLVSSLLAAVMQQTDDNPQLYIREMAQKADLVVIGTTENSSMRQKRGSDRIIGTAQVTITVALKGDLKKDDRITVTYIALDPDNSAGGIFSLQNAPYIFFLKKGEKADSYQPVHKRFGIQDATSSNIGIVEKALKIKVHLPKEKLTVKSEKSPAEYGYAIVVSEATNSDANWGEVVKKLQSKYKKAKLFTYSSSIDEVKQAVWGYYPRYVCFVAKPTESGASFVRTVISFMRTLDDDPYEDAIWAILTGYDAEDAIRIATAEPLTVEFGLLHASGGWLKWFKKGLFFSETKPGMGSLKESRQPVKNVAVPRDTTEPFVKALNNDKVQLIITSGHATERDWQMGYPRWGGKIVAAGGGNLVGRASTGKVYPIKTANPKIYYGWGNCLIAHINTRECMCLSWIHNGCNHFYGHIIPQMRQCTAPGIGHYFFTLQDRFTFAEAAYITRQAARFTQAPAYERCLGGTVLYGDPAYQARMARSVKPAYDQKLTTRRLSDGRYKVTFRIKANYDIGFSPRSGGAAVAFLPVRATIWSAVKGDGKVKITDNLVMMQIDGKLKKGATRKVTFTVEFKDFRKRENKTEKDEKAE